MNNKILKNISMKLLLDNLLDILLNTYQDCIEETGRQGYME